MALRTKFELPGILLNTVGRAFTVNENTHPTAGGVPDRVIGKLSYLFS
jgi:hypothetical protein